MEGNDILFHIGPLAISSAIATTWAIMAVLGVLSWALTRNLREEPGTVQTILEGIVVTIEAGVASVMPDDARRLLPFIGTLWIYLCIANLAGVVPGLHSPTGDLSMTAALAFCVFLAVHWYGIRTEGLLGYARHYFSPSPIMFPFHVISELSRTVALAVRLFGNMASLEMAALLVLLVAGFLVPVPLLLLHVIEALVQAYIFGMLALVYIAGGIESQHTLKQQKGSES